MASLALSIKQAKTTTQGTGTFDIDAAGNLVDTRGNLLLGTLANFTPTTPSATALKKIWSNLKRPTSLHGLARGAKSGRSWLAKGHNTASFFIYAS